MNDRAVFTSTTNHLNVSYTHDPQRLHSSGDPGIYNGYEPMMMDIDETNQSHSDEKPVANLRPEIATNCQDEKLDSTSSVSSTSIEPQATNADTADILILLDWDNTIFPSTVIEHILNESKNNKFGFVCVENGVIQLFNELATVTLQLLSELIAKYGSDNIHIVTNSTQGWIQQSLAHAACISTGYKDIEQLLFGNDITMLSAQNMFGTLYKEPVEWKTACFTHLFDSHRTKSHYSHILSIGDQYTDHLAVKGAIQTLQYAPIHHMVKLKEAPTIKDMICEMEYLRAAFHFIFNVFENTRVIEPRILDYHDEESKHYYHRTLTVNAQSNATNSI